MKNNIILSLLFALMALASCTENFEPTLHGTLSPQNFPQTEQDYFLYTIEVYKPFGSKWGYQELGGGGYRDNFHSYEYGHIFMFDAPTDNMAMYLNGWGSFFEATTKADFEFFVTQGESRSHFSKTRFVTRITEIINRLEGADLKDASKNLLLAEAKLARAWTMYYLLHLYGPVPVILDPALIGTDAENNLERPTREEYVAAMEQDLRFATAVENGLPNKQWESEDFYGRFTRGFGLTLLQRMYMNERMFSQAEKVGREITTMGYALVTAGSNPYQSLFQPATQRNTENIYAITVDPQSTGAPETGNINAWTYYCYPADYKGKYQNGGWSNPHGVFMANWAFYDSFSDDDLRKSTLVGHYENISGATRDRSNMNGAVIKKYADDIDNEGGFQANDIIIARYADVLLMLAEAINENNNGPNAEAIDFVNQIRTRAGLSDLSIAETANKEAFNAAILRERNWELFFEGTRKMDLIRHGKWESSISVLGKVSKHQVLPIPNYVLDMGMTQTEGF